MKNIFAVCPNPSVDLTVTADDFNEEDLKNLKSPEITYSGKAINAVKSAAILGVCGTASGFMFEDDREGYEKSLASFGCGCDFVTVPGSVRRNVKICGTSGRLTELNAKGSAVSDAAKRSLSEKIREASGEYKVSVISGSLPKNCGPGYYGVLSDACRSKYKIIDTDGDNMRSALVSGATLVKPNLAEAERISGIKISGKEDAFKAASAFIRLGAGIVLMSLGERGAAISDGQIMLGADAPKVTVRSSVGAGDAMVGAAAVILSHLGGELTPADVMPEILKAAVAAGSASVISAGTNLFSKDDFERLYKEIKPVKLI